MLKRILVLTLAIVSLSATALWAQHGAWEGCTLKGMMAGYTDQQMGGFLLHDSATLVKEASRALARARTPEERRILSSLLSRASGEMEEISIRMKEKRLSRKDIEKFHQDLGRLRKQIQRISR